MRQLKEHEMLCRFGCQTIATKELSSCEMCCADAVSERVARLEPIIAEAQRKAEELTASRVGKAFDSEPSEEPAPKKRGRPSKEV